MDSSKLQQYIDVLTNLRNDGQLLTTEQDETLCMLILKLKARIDLENRCKKLIHDLRECGVPGSCSKECSRYQHYDDCDRLELDAADAIEELLREYKKPQCEMEGAEDDGR